jgi:hypothetical protein
MRGRTFKRKKDFTSTDCRNTAMQVHIMTQFYLHTGDKRYLESAKKVIDIFIKLQKSDGSWPGRFSEPDGPPHPSFTEHALWLWLITLMQRKMNVFYPF